MEDGVAFGADGESVAEVLDVAAFEELPAFTEEGCTDFGAYCETVEHSSEWGGQLEIAALAHARKRKVTVYSADAPALTAGEEYDDESPILLAFHRHYFGLGAHYNAVVPK